MTTNPTHRGRIDGEPVSIKSPRPAGGVQLETFVPWTLVRRGVRKQVITPIDAPAEFADEARLERQARKGDADTPLMRALGLAHHWQRLLDEGRCASLRDIAAAEGIDLGQASKILRLAQLAPGVIEAAMELGIPTAELWELLRRFAVQWDPQVVRIARLRATIAKDQ